MNVIITGAVAVGKTHTQEQIIYHLNETVGDKCVLYPEFVYNDSLANELVVKRFTHDINRISPLTFQNYIMDKWEYYAKLNPFDESKFNIFERLPEDAVEIFAKLSLNELEYQTQVIRLEDIKKILPISYYTMNKDDTVWITYNNNWITGNDNINKLFEVLDDIITERKVKNIIIEIRSDTAYKNCQIRNRKGEEHYTKDDIETLVEVYNTYMNSILNNIHCKQYII